MVLTQKMLSRLLRPSPQGLVWAAFFLLLGGYGLYLGHDIAWAPVLAVLMLIAALLLIVSWLRAGNAYRAYRKGRLNPICHGTVTGKGADSVLSVRVCPEGVQPAEISLTVPDHLYLRLNEGDGIIAVMPSVDDIRAIFPADEFSVENNPSA